MPTRSVSQPLILAASFSCASLASASNPNVTIVESMQGSLMTASRDGNVLVSSDFYLQNAGGGGGGGFPGFPSGPIWAPLNIWGRSTGTVALVDWPPATVVRCADAHGDVMAGTEFQGGWRDAPEGPILWKRSPVTGDYAFVRLPVPSGVSPARSDGVNWLGPDGSIGLGYSGGSSLTRWTGLTGPNPVAEWLRRDGSASSGNPWVSVIYCTDPVASDDGRLVAGTDIEAGPFLWRSAPGGGYVPLPILEGWSWTWIRAMTPDGATIVGTAIVEGPASIVVRWTISPIDGSATIVALTGADPPYITPSGNIVGLGGRVAEITDDGQIIGFNALSETSMTPMLWLSSGTLGSPSPSGIGRVVPLVDYLAAHGVSMTGITQSFDDRLRPAELVSVSADGRSFAGHGYVVKADSEGSLYDASVIWTARIPAPCGPADLAGLGAAPGWDGQLTPDDLILFLSSWFAGDIAIADFASIGGGPTPDGRLTADDLIAFLASFLAGCP